MASAMRDVPRRDGPIRAVRRLDNPGCRGPSTLGGNGAVTGSDRRVHGTGRVEAFSDGVIAFIVTLLIFEVRLPEVPEGSNAAMWDAVAAVAPKFLGFTVSFFTVAIFWVNHHYFFSRITHTDWKVLWANNLLLFSWRSCRSRRRSSATIWTPRWRLSSTP